VIRDAGPEITNALGALLRAARTEPGFGGAVPLEALSLTRGPLVSVAHTNSVCDNLAFRSIWVVWY
jgi:hypothetical protein